jgi:regulator of ribonuclease activity A
LNYKQQLTLKIFNNYSGLAVVPLRSSVILKTKKCAAGKLTMEYNTSELCDIYTDLIDVLEPIFSNYGGRSSFGGKVVTVKCFENNGLIEEVAGTDGTGKVMVIDGGGSTRRALINIKITELAAKNNWEGILCFGSVRDVDALEEVDIGVQGLLSIPVGASDSKLGESDLAINFAGVTFLPDDHIYADNTGVILSPDPLDIE